jgi:signal transduction histidine kinase
MKKAIKILCLEDVQDDFELINRILKKGGLLFTSTRVDTKEEYENALLTYNPDVILSDHALPHFDSTEALMICKAKQPQIPFILVTGAVSEEFAVDCMKQGADDYILKSSLNRLPSAVENAIKYKHEKNAKEEAMSKLAKQNEQLLKINSELDSFVYSVSHNIKAPLMSVLGLLNLAEYENSIEQLHGYHGMMRASILRLDETIKEILDFSKNARHELSIEPIDLKKLIEENLVKHKFMPGYQKLDITTSFEGQDFFFSDYYRVSIIVNNITSNAFKYLDKTKDEPFLHIKISVGRSEVVVEFQDNGIGIDKTLLPRIYDMFFRATDTGEGSGLGLYIVKEAINRLNGKIDIESEFGKGTLFRITLPNYYGEAKV